MIQATHYPDRVPLTEDVIADFLSTVSSTELFESKDIEWIESIITRPDAACGYTQLTKGFVIARPDGSDNLYAVCKTYNREKDKLTPCEKHDAKQMIAALLWSKRVSMYRQKKILVAAPQRKQHPKYQTPNLDHFEGAGQHVGCQIIALYGLDYVAARVQAVKQALSDADATHIMFVDDDVLIPKNAVQQLFDTGLPSVCGIYTKKTAALHTNTTTSGLDAEYIYAQKLVEPKVGDMTPQPTSCVGGGMWLMDLEVFRRIEEPWFTMLQGADMTVRVGEDSFWCQRLADRGVTTYVIPGIIGVHVDFSNGDCYGPTEIVDPMTMKIRPEYAKTYQAWPSDLDVRELLQPDKIDYFKKNEHYRSKGLMK